MNSDTKSLPKLIQINLDSSDTSLHHTSYTRKPIINLYTYRVSPILIFIKLCSTHW